MPNSTSHTSLSIGDVAPVRAGFSLISRALPIIAFSKPKVSAKPSPTGESVKQNALCVCRISQVVFARHHIRVLCKLLLSVPALGMWVLLLASVVFCANNGAWQSLLLSVSILVNFLVSARLSSWTLLSTHFRRRLWRDFVLARRFGCVRPGRPWRAPHPRSRQAAAILRQKTSRLKL